MLDAFKIKPYNLEPVFATWTDGPVFTGNPKKDVPVDEWLDKIKAGCEADTDDQGSWWTLKKKDNKDEATTAPEATPRPALARSGSIFRSSKSIEGETSRPVPTRSETVDAVPLRRALTRSNTESFWPRRSSKDATEDEAPPLPPKSSSVAATVTPKPQAPTRSNTIDAGGVTTVTQAPIWLLNACNALEYITSEHPKAMSIISAILITAGSIPALPAISAGAGGAVLASGAAHAIGAIAVGLGQALSTTMKNNTSQNQNDQVQVQASTTVR
ncbi:hypothetical protein DXG03_001375 [Asterophora parasitica]|uniref:Uncharacterized protein n=1 Tax=Asterophora parasitica TaxID=117018 RepID=A0A9P7KCT9_9AGAR|nr:hypothetical protein DXG03_001375 [Asterophora parasitica]